MDHVSARNSDEGCFAGRDPLTRCCASATYAAGVYRVGALVRPMGYSRPSVPKPRDHIDADDLKTFFVRYMKTEALAGTEPGHSGLVWTLDGGDYIGTAGIPTWPMDYSRPYIRKHGNQIDVDDVTTFFVTMKNDTMAGSERGADGLLSAIYTKT